MELERPPLLGGRCGRRARARYRPLTSSDERGTESSVWERERRSRAKAADALRLAQLILWLPLLSQAIAFGLIVFTIVSRGADIRASWPTSSWSMLVALLFLILYALSGWWIGARQRRGVWLGIALFAWSLTTSLLHGHPLSVRAGYAVLGLAIVIRAGRALGVKQLFLP